MAVWTGPLVAGVLLSLLALLLVRSTYVLIAPHSIDRDAYAHFLCAADVRNNGHRLPERPSSVVTTGGYGYPFFMHWVLSFLPPEWLPRLDRFFSPLADLSFAALLLATVPLGMLSPVESLVALWLFVLTPQFVRPDMPNAIGTSTRKPGLVLTTLSVLATTFWLAGSSPLVLVGAIVSGALVFLTSKFSVQAYAFVLVGFATLIDPVGVVVLAAAFVTAVVLSAGAYLPVFRGHLDHLYEYATVKQYKLAPVQSSLRERVAAIDDLAGLFRAAYHNRVIRPLVNAPFAIAALALMVLEFGGPRIDLPTGFRSWILVCLVAFVVTSLPHLRFLGKAERYLEYAFLPSAVYLARGLTQLGSGVETLLGGTLLAGASVIGLYAWTYTRLFHSRGTEAAWRDVLDRMGDLAPGTVVVQPFWRARHLAWATDHSVVDFVLNEGRTPGTESDRLCPREYAFVTADVDWLAETYDPDWVVFERDRLADLSESDLPPPDTAPVYENEEFSVYAFEDLGRQ